MSEPVYNLLQAINPSKIKLPISDRFAKLTLSSNKKQSKKDEDDGGQLLPMRDKRDSASRNLLEQLSQQAAAKSSPKNPLLRSESSKDASDEVNFNNLENDYETMDPLNVTDDSDDGDYLPNPDVALLSQKISALTVVSRHVSESSNPPPLHEVTQLVSTESQRSSMSDVRPFHNIEEVLPVSTSKQEVISLASSCSTKQNDKHPEITEDEDDDSSDDAITISDSSVSHNADDNNDMAMSTLNTVQETAESATLNLQGLSPEKMQRVAAFLRDVSMEQRHIEEHGGRVSMEDIEYNNNVHTEQADNMAKAHKIASAETESMTPDDDDETEVTAASVLERERRLQALDEREYIRSTNSNGNDLTPRNGRNEDNARRLANDETQDNSVLTDINSNNSLVYEAEEVAEKTPQNNVRRIAYDETLDDTRLDELEENSPKTFATPKNTESAKRNVRKIANAETEDNTIMTENKLDTSEIYESPKIEKPPRKNDNLRIAMDETLDNTNFNMSVNTPAPKNSDKARHLAQAETEVNTSSSATLSPDWKVLPKNMAEQDTEINTSHSITSSPEIITQKKREVASSPNNSFVNTSMEEASNDTAPEHSITILETDEEDHSQSEKHSPPKSPQASDNNKLSNSFQSRDNDSEDEESDSSSSMSKIQMSMASINISAKINIKIHIPNSTESSEYEDDDDSDKPSAPRANSMPDKAQSETNTSRYRKTPSKESRLETPQKMSHDLSHSDVQNDSKHDESAMPSDKSSSQAEEEEEDEKFVDEAQKLLNQLYGKSWQTPDVIRNLKRTSGSGEKNSIKRRGSSSIKRNQQEKEAKEKNANKSGFKMVEDSILGDFSMFRRNIVQTNLDSTRLVTPKTKSKQVNTKQNCFTEPKNAQKAPIRNQREHEFKAPQTEVRKQRIRTPAMTKVSNDRWRQIVDNDSDSEGNNASDDDDADKSSDESWKADDPETAAKGKTGKTIDKKEPAKKPTRSKKVNKYIDDNADSGSDTKASDVSWKADDSNAEESDSDFEKCPGQPKRNTTKQNRTKCKKPNNSQDDLVYLDLSKEEISILENVPESPPANHDVTFASRLDEILKTCSQIDKPKLPSSAQSTKTKRKLFTPMFGDDVEDKLPLVEKVEKENKRLLQDERQSIIFDNATCPFDAHGRPKRLEIINKQLESVKIGKPIFQLTPSPKKTPATPRQEKTHQTPSSKTTPLTNRKENNQTPTSKTKVNNKTKPIATSARKADPKKLDDIGRTPDYKYSFLKSLDVTVSKVFCHPDALLYRDNYRTKKEDLSVILHELYNEKLFGNKLDVPITWNKKLINTAGRCLNKKKLGIRSSVIELSDKVLTSADRLRCTLIHELCHAATWIFNGEGGHGKTWKEWAYRANATFPELPKIGVCHQYEIEYKYTYKCTLCAAKSYAHSKSKKVENIRCSYCHGAIEIFLNKKDKDGNIMPMPVKEPTGFAKFVKDNYKKYKREDTKHADVMKILSSEYAAIKLTKNGEK